jgi:cytochrome c5
MPGEETEASAPVLQPAAEPEPVAAAMTGPQVYNSACLACHGAGVGGAPILGDVDAWKARIAQGEEVLYEHAINGYQGPSGGYMPPKGGRLDLSDDEVKLAVDYILAQTE